MDKRKSYYIVLDTETCNGITVDGKLDLTCSLVYDIGYQVIDKKGYVYERRSFLVKEIFCNESELMNSAYYAKKIPTYIADLNKNIHSLKGWSEIKKIFLHDFYKYNIKAVVAHNAKFDLNALNVTTRWITKSKYRYFFPFGTPIFDTLIMSRDTIGKEIGYIIFCQRHNFMTKHKKPRVKLTAEVLYRYISGNYDFVEAHTGLRDVEIESQIFVTCLAKHKKMQKNLFKNS